MQPPNPYAFPSTDNHPSYVVPIQHEGMTLRDYFAAQAISALVARHRADFSWSSIPANAYALADAMLAERNK